MLTIASKARLIANDMADKAKRGSKLCEIHMADEFNSMTAEELYEFAVQDGCFEVMDIISVHSPLVRGRDCVVERLADHPDIESTFGLAQMIAEREGHEVVVVVHTSAHPEILERYGALQDKLDFIRKMVDDHPDTVAAIEMGAPIDLNAADDLNFFVPQNTFILEDDGTPSMGNIEFVKRANHPRVTALVDIVHVQMFASMMRAYAVYFDEPKYSEVADSLLETVIADAAPYMRHMHFARGIGNAYGPDRHGMPFPLDDELAAEEADRAFKVLIDNGFDGNLVIEVIEQDYHDSVNFEATYATVRALCDKYGVVYRS